MSSSTSSSSRPNWLKQPWLWAVLIVIVFDQLVVPADWFARALSPILLPLQQDTLRAQARVGEARACSTPVVLFLGSSHTREGVDVELLNTLLDGRATCYNLGMSGNDSIGLYCYEHYLRDLRPEIIVVESYVRAFDGNIMWTGLRSRSSRKQFRLLWEHAPDLSEQYLADATSIIDVSMAAASNLRRYGDELKRLPRTALRRALSRAPKSEFAYHRRAPQDRIDARLAEMREEDWPEPGPYGPVEWTAAAWLLDDLAHRSETVIYLHPPIYPEYLEVIEDKHRSSRPQIDKLLAQKGLRSLAPQDSVIFSPMAFTDHSHLNESGREQLARWLAPRLTEMLRADTLRD